MPSKNAAYVSYAGKEHFVSNYEVRLLVTENYKATVSDKLNIFRDYLVTDFRGFHLDMGMYQLVLYSLVTTKVNRSTLVELISKAA